MVRLFAFVVLILGMTHSVAQAFDPLGVPFRSIPAELAKTCDHYDNRARFKPRGAGASLEAVFADSCNAALRSLVVSLDTNPYEARRAADFLDRLHTLRTTIIAMNTERIFGPNPAPRAKPISPATYGVSTMVKRSQTVTAAGEYLIAREMGVWAAYRDWARTAQFDVAAR